MSCCFVECKLFFPNEEYVDFDRDTLLKFESTTKEKRCTCKFYPIGHRLRKLWSWLCFLWLHKRARTCRKVTFLILFVLCLLAFTILFVAVPLIFMNSIAIQRRVVFGPSTGPHEEFDKPVMFYLDYDTRTFYRPMNFYVNASETTTPDAFLGSWHLLPRALAVDSKNASGDGNYNFFAGDYPAVLFLHATRGDRRSFASHYNLLRRAFHVISFDYRGYGDSSATALSEESLVEDAVEMYKWLRSNTNGSTYIWGDRLGAAVAVGVVARLHDEGSKPTGLILEEPSESLTATFREYWSFTEILSWLPWYKATILDPLERNGFSFNMTKYIPKVDCPVMIWQWGSYTPTKEEIVEQFETLRDVKKQGFVTYPLDLPYFSPQDTGNSRVQNTIENFVSKSRPIRPVNKTEQTGPL